MEALVTCFCNCYNCCFIRCCFTCSQTMLFQWNHMWYFTFNVLAQFFFVNDGLEFMKLKRSLLNLLPFFSYVAFKYVGPTYEVFCFGRVDNFREISKLSRFMYKKMEIWGDKELGKRVISFGWVCNLSRWWMKAWCWFTHLCCTRLSLHLIRWIADFFTSIVQRV